MKDLMKGPVGLALYIVVGCLPLFSFVLLTQPCVAQRVVAINPDRSILPPPGEEVASSIQHELVEMWLKKYPQEMFEHVEQAYSDDRLTYSEYRILQIIKESEDTKQAKARTKSLLKEIRDGRRSPEKPPGGTVD